MAKYRFFTSALCMLISANAAAADTLDECHSIVEGLASIVKNNPDIWSAKASIEQSQAQLQTVRSRRLPQLSAFARSGVGDGALQSAQTDNQVGVQFSFQIFDFGRSRYQVESAAERVAAGEYNLKALRYQLADEYFYTVNRLHHARQLVQLYRNRISTLQSRLSSADRQLQSGTITRLDYARLHAEKSFNEVELADAISRERAALLNLERLMAASGQCIKIDELSLFLSNVGHANLDQLIARTHEDPELREIEKQLSSARSELVAEQRAQLPTLSLSGFTSQTYDDFSNRFEDRNRIGLEVSMPILDGGLQNSYSLRQAARVQELRWQLVSAQRAKTSEVQQTWARAVALRDGLNAAEQARDSSLAYVEATGRRKELGASTVDDLLDAEERLLDLDIRILRLEAELVTALIDLIDNELLAQRLRDTGMPMN